MKEFKTILQNATSEIEEKKSKFIGNIFYVETVKEAEQQIKEIKKKYFDARHHCYAYRIVENDSIVERQSDDGEPSGTAGAPMLKILNKNDLNNVLIVVTRYFGGILLGTGGLVRAYSDATLKAIENTNVCMQELGHEAEVTIMYKDLEKFKYYCHKNSINVINTIYEKNIICTIEISNEEKQKLIEEKHEDIQILQYTEKREKYIRKN